MTQANISCFLLFVFSLFPTTPLIAAESSLRFQEYLEKADNHLKAQRHFEAGDALKEASKIGGAQHPSIHMRLGVLYYDLGLIPEAISEGENAVALSPSSRWYKFDLAKFYLVDKQYPKAEEQLMTLLKLDPGFTLGYYYLAVLYYRNYDFDMAWLSLRRASLLGHRDKHLEEVLTTHTSKPTENFDKIPHNDKIFRFIKCSSEGEVKTTLNEIINGKQFENIELDLKKENNGETNFGVITLKELQGLVREPIPSQQPYSQPIVVRTTSGYRIIQRIAPFDPVFWRTTLGNSPTTVNLTPSPAITSIPREDTSAVPISSMEESKERLTTQLAAYYAIESWKNAWQSANVSKYFAAYSNKFTPPENMDLNTWRKKREKSLTRPKFIHVIIKNPIIEPLKDGQLLITFNQTFESDIYQDTVIKTLIMAKEVGGWKILEERTAQEFSQ